MGKIAKIVAILVVILSCIAATWDQSTQKDKHTTYTVEGDTKWDTNVDSYKESTIDDPDPGFYRYPANYTLSDSWPTWAKDRFSKLASGWTDELREKVQKYDVPILDANTKWMDAKADKNIGHIEISIPSFTYYTLVMIDPDDGIVDQDFKGTAKIYGLDDDKRYRIAAFDAKGILGMNVTAISDKYVHVLSSWPDYFTTGRIPTMAQKVVEDPNKDLWVSVYAPRGAGANYQFIDIYSLKAEGDFRSKFTVPLTATSVKSWDTDLLLETDGDVIATACETPMDFYFNGPSYLCRINTSGTTEWELTSSNVTRALAIEKISAGYVSTGTQLTKITTAGAVTNWGNTSTTIVGLNFIAHDIVKDTLVGSTYTDTTGTTTYSDPEVVTTCGGRQIYGPRLSNKYPGVASGTIDVANPDYAFDNDGTTGTYIHSLLTNQYLYWTFTNAQTINFWRVYLNESSPTNNVKVFLYYDNGGGWTENSPGLLWAAGELATKQSGVSVSVAATKWMLYIYNPVAIQQVSIYEWEMYGGTGSSPAVPEVAQYYVVSGVTVVGGSNLDGMLKWDTSTFSGVTGSFKAIAKNVREGGYMAAGTTGYYTDKDKSGHKASIGKCTQGGTVIWYKTYSQASEFTDIAACEDGGFLLAGTLYSGTSVQSRQAVVMKIDKDGNVDSKFPQTFKETVGLGADGVGVIETRDGGILMVGGSSDVANTSKPYLIKLDRFYRTCSHGDVCE